MTKSVLKHAKFSICLWSGISSAHIQSCPAYCKTNQPLSVFLLAHWLTHLNSLFMEQDTLGSWVD